MADEAAKSERARRRWKLLGQALLKQEVSRDTEFHTFEGYKLLPAPERITALSSDADRLIDRLRRIPATDSLIDALEESLLAIVALKLDCQSIDFLLKEPASSLDTNSHPLLSTTLMQRCSLRNCSAEWDTECDPEGTERLLRISFELLQPNAFAIQKYPLSDDERRYLLVRERVHLQVSLDELTSHHTSVDNTGNICIWDCEKVLVWCLQQEKQVPKTILELGVGMAGMAALSTGAKLIYLTDGHVNCIQNNRVNVRLMKAAGLLPDNAQVHCVVLPWNLDVDPSPIQADWTLVSDCTHFQDYHAELFWTITQSTKVDGIVWMCQPDRGKSLARFLEMIEASNGLFQVTERRYPVLEEKHQEFLQNDANYNPNVHRPRIYVLKKLREASDNDRAQALALRYQHK